MPSISGKFELDSDDLDDSKRPLPPSAQNCSFGVRVLTRVEELSTRNSELLLISQNTSSLSLFLIIVFIGTVKRETYLRVGNISSNFRFFPERTSLIEIDRDSPFLSTTISSLKPQFIFVLVHPTPKILAGQHCVSRTSIFVSKAN